MIGEINRQPIGGITDFERATGRVKDGDVVTLLVEREGVSRYVAFAVKRA